MTRPKLFVSTLLAAVLAVAVVSLRASDFMGCYAMVDKVVLEPNDTEPTAIQVWGAFAMTDGRMGGTYLPAVKGYLYFTCAKGQDTPCLTEWSDLKSVAGKQQMVGFGMRYAANGRIRKADEKPASPDVYPIQMGLFKFAPPAAGPTATFEDLKKALAAK